MALNFLGLGFSLGAQDKGLSSAIKDTTSGLGDISKSIVGIGLAAAKMVIRVPDFGPAHDLANTLSNDIKLNTTAMEAYGVQASKATSAGLAGLNMTDEQFQKSKGIVSGVAFSMNADLGSVTKSFAALQQAGVDVKKFGFSDFEEFQKVMEVTGTDAVKMAGAMGKLQVKMGANPKLMKATVGQIIALGKQTGIGREALAGMSETVTMLTDNMNMMPESWDKNGVSMNRFLRGTTAVAGALVKMGLTGDEAVAASNQLTKALLQGQQGLDKMYSGVANDMPDIAKVMTTQLGDAGTAFKLLSESPDQFMLKMGNLVEQVRNMPGMTEGKMKMFRQQLQGVIGPEAMNVFTKEGIGKMGPILAKAQAPIDQNGKAIGEMAKKYEDGRTYAERFAIAQDMIQTKLKKVKGVMSDSTYLKVYVEQGKAFTAWASATAAKGGPLGKLTDMLIEVKNRGFGGFLASHSKFGFAMAESLKMMQPLMQYLPAIKMAFTALTGPIGLVVAAIGGLYFAIKDLNKGKDSFLRPLIDKAVAEAPVIFNKVIEIVTQVFDTVWKTLAGVDWGKVIDTVYNALIKVVDVIFKVVDSIDWNKVGQVLGMVLMKAADLALVLVQKALNLFERIAKWFGSLDWGAIGNTLGGYLAEAASIAIQFIWKVFSHLPEIMTTIIQKAVDAVVGILDGIKNWLIKKFPSAAKPITVVFDIIKGIVKFVGGALKLAWDVVVGVVKIVWKVLGGIWDVVKAVGGFLYKVWKASFDVVLSVLGWIWDKIKAVWDVAKKVGSAIGGFFSKIGSGIKSLFTGGDQLSEMSEKLKKQQLQNAQEIMDKQMAMIKQKHDEWVKAEHAAGRATDGYVKTVEGDIIRAVDAFTRYEKDATGTIVKVAHETAKYVGVSVGGEAWQEARETAEKDSKIWAKYYGNLKQGSEEWLAAQEKASQEVQPMIDAFRDKFGIDYMDLISEQEKLNMAFSVQGKVVDEAKKHGIGYYTALTSMQQSYTDRLGQIRFQMMQLEAQGDKTSDKYKALDDQFKKLNADGVAQIENYQVLMTGNVSKLVDSYTTSAREAEGLMIKLKEAGKEGTDEYGKLADKVAEKSRNAEMIAHSLAEVYRTQIVDMLKNVPEKLNPAADKVRETVQGMVNQIADMQKKELTDFLANTQLTGTALDTELKNRQKKYQDQMDQVRKIVNDNNKLILSGTADGALKSLAEVQKGMDQIGHEVDVKTKQAATEIQKQFGVSGEAALESVNQIAAIDPNIFRRNMGVVKKTFMDFLSEMDAKGKKLLDNTTKSFNTLWDTMNNGWKKHTDLLDTFTKKAEETIDKFWTAILSKAANAAAQLIQVTDSITIALNAMAKNINLMDLLASPDQITQWAASVVSALAYAFRTGGAADAMIGASYQKALAMAGEIQRSAAGPATPDTSKTSASPAASSVTAASELLRTMNHPAWASNEKELIPSQLAMMNEQLRATLAALAEMAKGRAVTPPRQKPIGKGVHS